MLRYVIPLKFFTDVTIDIEEVAMSLNLKVTIPDETVEHTGDYARAIYIISLIRRLQENDCKYRITDPMSRRDMPPKKSDKLFGGHIISQTDEPVVCALPAAGDQSTEQKKKYG